MFCGFSLLILQSNLSIEIEISEMISCESSVLLDNHLETFEAELSLFLGNKFFSEKSFDLRFFGDLALTAGEQTSVEFVTGLFDEWFEGWFKMEQSFPGSGKVEFSGNFDTSSALEKKERTST